MSASDNSLFFQCNYICLKLRNDNFLSVVLLLYFQTSQKLLQRLDFLFYHRLSSSLANLVVYVWEGFQAEWKLNTCLKNWMTVERLWLTSYLIIKLLLLLEHLAKFFIAHQSFCIQGLKAALFKSELFKLAKGVCTAGKARFGRKSNTPRSTNIVQPLSSFTSPSSEAGTIHNG